MEESESVDVEGTSGETSTPTPPIVSSQKQSKSSAKKSKPTNLSPPTTAVKATTSTASAVKTSTANAKKTKRRRDSGTSSEEERWLSALESGKLEDVDDELKKMKDPTLMTARQRAMYDRNNDRDFPGAELLMSLPIGYREKEKPQTAEEIQKAALKSQKRKQLADEKREKDKKKTMERLLKKQDSKQRASGRKNVKAAPPMMVYRNTQDGAYIQMPPEHEFPLKAQVAIDPPKRQLCGIAGCGQAKVYNCSKTNMPLCSFACYRKNVQAIKQIMC